MSSPWIINVAELLRRPGSSRTVQLTPTVTELGIGDDPRFADDAEFAVTLQLESLGDGIVVHGTVRVPWQGTCRRCLANAEGEVEGEVRELYQLTLTDPEAFAIVADQIDLRTLVREVAVLDASTNPVCRPDCAGLCPVCGIDRNETSCNCEIVSADPRWEALTELKSQLGEPS